MIFGRLGSWRSRKRWQLRTTCVLLLSLAFGFAEAVKQVDENANGTTIETEKDESLHIRLSENRTAGYKWTVRSDGSPVCQLLNEHFVPATGGLGTKGVHHWQFQCVRDGLARIEFEYARSWEKAAKPIRVFSIDINVKN